MKKYLILILIINNLLFAIDYGSISILEKGLENYSSKNNPEEVVDMHKFSMEKFNNEFKKLENDKKFLYLYSELSLKNFECEMLKKEIEI